MNDGRWPSSGQRITDIEQRMSITRHNYEEYFILYMDNELSNDERRMVEAFVQQHPDLKEELELLQQFKLTPDSSIVFAGKEELLKENGESLITIYNYEEWLMLYSDNELTPLQKEKVESFIAAHPSLNNELALLQKARLQPETIVFANKESLYRREEKVRRIVPIWLRVAAVLLIAVGLGTILLVKNKTKEPAEIVSSQKDDNKIAPVVSKKNENKDVAENNKDNKVTPEKVETIPANKKQTPAAPVYQTALTKYKNDNSSTIAEIKKEVKDKQQPEIKQQPVIATINNKPDNNLPKPDNNPFINKKVETNNAVVKDNIPKENSNNSLTSSNVTKKEPSPSGIQKASLTETPDDEVVLNDSRKNKSRGLFRKIVRTFEKRTNIGTPDDDGRLLVAGFAFRTK